MDETTTPVSEKVLVIKLSGRIGEVFGLLNLMARLYPNITLKDIISQEEDED